MMETQNASQHGNSWLAGFLVGIALLIPIGALISCVQSCDRRLTDASFAKGYCEEVGRQVIRLERRVDRLERH